MNIPITAAIIHPNSIWFIISKPSIFLKTISNIMNKPTRIIITPQKIAQPRPPPEHSSSHRLSHSLSLAFLGLGPPSVAPHFLQYSASIWTNQSNLIMIFVIILLFGYLILLAMLAFEKNQRK